MTQVQVTKGNITITPELARVLRSLKRCNKKNRPTPPAPQNQLRRFTFFTGTNGKGYPKEKIHFEMQRYAFTREGNKMFRSIQKQQAQDIQKKQKSQQSEMKILPQKKSLFGGLKNIFKKSQRGS